MKRDTKFGLGVAGIGLGVLLLNLLWIAAVAAVIVVVVKAIF